MQFINRMFSKLDVKEGRGREGRDKGKEKGGEGNGDR